MEGISAMLVEWSPSQNPKPQSSALTQALASEVLRDHDSNNHTEGQLYATH